MGDRNLIPFFAAGLFLWAVVFESLAGNTTITVHAGEQQTFYGIGASSTSNPEYCNLSQELRDTLAKVFWVEGNMTNMRLWAWCGYSGEQFYNHYRCYVEDALKARPDILVYLGPNGWIGGHSGPRCPIDQRVQDAVEQIAYCREKGWPIVATGMTNEPSVNGKASPQEIVSMIKQMRAALDARGMEDVKTIAPEVPGVDGAATSFIGAILADQQALNALDAFSTHSYTMNITKQLRDQLLPYKKEYWMTESSNNGPEEPGDEQVAGRQAGAVLSDINLGVTHWTHFIGYESYGGDDNRTHIIGYHDINDLGILLKFYYYKQIGHTITPGSVARLCESSAEGWMVNTYGTQPAVCAAAAVNPDGTWGLAAVNKTNTGYDQWGYHSQGAATWEVTFHVEELADEGDIEFKVMRSSAGAQNVLEAPLTMRNGEISVTIPSAQIVSLRNGDFSSGMTVSDYEPPRAPRQHAHQSIRVDQRAGGVRVRFDGPAGEAVQANIYDLRGKRVASLSGILSPSGNCSVTWVAAAGAPIPAGTYVAAARVGHGCALLGSTFVVK